MTAPVAVSVHALEKRFGGIPVLSIDRLRIEPGEILVLLGPSGCGKTTLLRLIAGLETPEPGGTILFDADDVTALTIERRQVGMVFQSYALFPNMNVAENIGYGLRIRGIPRIEREAEVARLLDIVGLTEFATRRVDRLSGGQRQRVALARAIAIKPRILLLDEPLAALDAALRDRLRLEIARLLRQFAITAVYVTHDQAEAMAIGHRIAVMERGHIVQLDVPEGIYAAPATPFVAGFVGAMNRVTGAMRDGRFVAGGLDLRRPEPDGPLTLWFRPEALHPAGPEDANLVGKVLEATFLGPIRRVAIDIGAGTPILADLPVTVDAAIDQTLRLRLPAHACLTFADRSSEPLDPESARPC